MHLLQAPLLADKLGGQPVQQLRMGWGHAHLPEIAWCGDNAAAEVPIPHSVHHHPRRQRIVGRGNPFGKGTAATACKVAVAWRVCNSWRTAASQNLEVSRFDNKRFLVLSHVHTV